MRFRIRRTTPSVALVEVRGLWDLASAVSSHHTARNAGDHLTASRQITEITSALSRVHPDDAITGLRTIRTALSALGRDGEHVCAKLARTADAGTSRYWVRMQMSLVAGAASQACARDAALAR